MLWRDLKDLLDRIVDKYPDLEGRIVILRDRVRADARQEGAGVEQGEELTIGDQVAAPPAANRRYLVRLVIDSRHPEALELLEPMIGDDAHVGLDVGPSEHTLQGWHRDYLVKGKEGLVVRPRESNEVPA
ncbi:MAG: hypothetical protein H6948_01080 [Zoogloeaceae bacterium]|nr:hypothetical protein [Zoogloeaceae bacterium]